jgi:hypothetical protein
MEEDEIIAYLEQYYECYDRFTFNKHIRYLLRHGYDHEEAKDLILAHCVLSALSLQEMIYNEYYLKISIEETFSEDLKKEIELAQNEELNNGLKRSGRHN